MMSRKGERHEQFVNRVKKEMNLSDGDVVKLDNHIPVQYIHKKGYSEIKHFCEICKAITYHLKKSEADSEYAWCCECAYESINTSNAKV